MITPTAPNEPLLPLETWRALFGYNPLHYWGLYSTIGSGRLTSACNSLVPEYSWQRADASSREDLRAAIVSAEAKLTQYLRYSPAPRYVTCQQTYPKYLAAGIWQWGQSDPSGLYRSVTLDEGYVQALGVESLTAIDETAAVTRSDEDGDGYEETFTLSVVTTETDPAKIAVYIPEAVIPVGAEWGERWRLSPVTITISGGTATIVGKSWQIVDPVLYQGLATYNGINADDASVYLAELAVYRRVTDPDGTTVQTSQGYFQWEPVPPCCGGIGCAGCGASVSSDAAAIATSIARVGIRNAEAGVVIPGMATYNVATSSWSGTYAWNQYCLPPQSVTVRGLLGYPLVNGSMQRQMALVVARLAAAELARPVCACDNGNSGNRELYRWQFDLARSSGANDEAYGAVSAQDLDNPLGTRRGHVQAWRFILNQQRGEGILV